MDVSEITTEQMVDSLYSKICPACGLTKKPERTLCYCCFAELPKAQQQALYARVGKGYEPAVREALSALGAERWHV